ncbi:MAG: TraR/DksA C4-type zinc finger protein [Nitrospirota bacterium]
MPQKPKGKTPTKAKTKATGKPAAKSSAKPKAAAKAPVKAAAKTKVKVKEKPAKAVDTAAKKVAPPAEDENTRKARLRKVLIQKREEIIKEAKDEIKKFKSGERRQLVETVMDDGDMSVVDLSEDISLRQLSSHRETLIKIDAALRKLEEGTYGICEECGDEISEERLKIMPFAIYCRDDQERREMIERLEREES